MHVFKTVKGVTKTEILHGCYYSPQCTHIKKVKISLHCTSMCYCLAHSRCVEKLLLDQLIFYHNKPCLFSAYCNFIMSIYCLLKAIQLYIQQLDLQKAVNKHTLLR